MIFFFDIDDVVYSEGYLKLADVEALGLTKLEIGDIILSGNDITDSTQLPADGRAISRTTYSALFAKWGTRFGAGNGSTTFNLPDMGGVVPRGQGINASMTKADGNFYNGGAIGTKILDQMQTLWGAFDILQYQELGYSPVNYWQGVFRDGGAVLYSSSSTEDSTADRYWTRTLFNSTYMSGARAGVDTHDASMTLNFKVKVL